jgi:hypothetical protein
MSIEKARGWIVNGWMAMAQAAATAMAAEP